MNLVVAKGNMTDEPKVTYTQGGKAKAEFTLALNRTKEGADFPRFIAWEQKAELIEKYCHKGTGLLIKGHIQTGSYDGKNGKVYTTDVIVDNLEFTDKKPKEEKQDDGFMKIPEGIDKEIPFN